MNATTLESCTPLGRRTWTRDFLKVLSCDRRETNFASAKEKIAPVRSIPCAGFVSNAQNDRRECAVSLENQTFRHPHWRSSKISCAKVCDFGIYIYLVFKIKCRKIEKNVSLLDHKLDDRDKYSC